MQAQLRLLTPGQEFGVTIQHCQGSLPPTGTDVAKLRWIKIRVYRAAIRPVLVYGGGSFGSLVTAASVASNPTRQTFDEFGFTLWTPRHILILQ